MDGDLRVGAGPPALVGLARVSAAHGAAEDAVVFATEALNMEPASEAAREILGRFAPAARRVIPGG